MAQILAFIMQSKYPRLQRVGAPRHSSSSSDAEPTILRNERPQLQSVRALGHRSSASAAQPASFGSVMTDSVSELAPEQIWTIRPSYPQPSSTEFEPTHDRPMPLPFAIDLVIRDRTYACRYAGHGKSKVAYKINDAPMVLKLTANEDEEPDVCKQLSSSCSAVQPDLKICPAIYTIGRCQEQDQWGKPTRDWFAWLAEYAFPLDKYMQDMHVDRKACLKIALYKQVIAAQHVSDAEVRSSTAVRRLH